MFSASPLAKNHLRAHYPTSYAGYSDSGSGRKILRAAEKKRAETLSTVFLVFSPLAIFFGCAPLSEHLKQANNNDDDDDDDDDDINVRQTSVSLESG